MVLRLMGVEHSSELPEKVEGKGEETSKHILYMHLALLSVCDKACLGLSRSPEKLQSLDEFCNF